MKRLALLALLLMPATARAASLSDLSWMSGAWSGMQAGVTAEEYWSPATGTLMTSVHRDLKEGRTFSFEFLRIEQKNDSLTYIAMPRGRNETRFPLKSLDGRKVVFENPGHDYPQRILYWQDEAGKLHARTEGTLKGKLESEEWTWERAKP